MVNGVELHGQELEKVVKQQPNTCYNAAIIRLKDWLKGDYATKTAPDFFSDGVHPSKLTYQVWAKDFADFLSKSDW